MGLDQTWFKTKTKPTSEVDFEAGEWGKDFDDIYDHRKIPALQDYMTTLYISKGGEDIEFNSKNLQLTLDDLEDLEQEVFNKTLNEEASGFCWGEHEDEHYVEIQEAINIAKKAIEDGYYIFYNAWY